MHKGLTFHFALVLSQGIEQIPTLQSSHHNLERQSLFIPLLDYLSAGFIILLQLLGSTFLIMVGRQRFGQDCPPGSYPIQEQTTRRLPAAPPNSSHAPSCKS
jgi:hypothetical protein